jgi:hypothetical protein
MIQRREGHQFPFHQLAIGRRVTFASHQSQPFLVNRPFLFYMLVLPGIVNIGKKAINIFVAVEEDAQDQAGNSFLSHRQLTGSGTLSRLEFIDLYF